MTDLLLQTQTDGDTTSDFERDIDLKGLVFNIQRFSVHDGPGIRSTVFMKGCPLSCLWCANPESQDFSPQLMTRDLKCTGCGACAASCPQGAIRITAHGGRDIDWHQCEQCLQCVDACMFGALIRSGEPMSIEKVFDEVLRDQLFYKNSGGGITVSGGEPLLQSGFVAALLKTSKAHGLHTAVDTTGYVAWSKIQSIVHWADLLLWDLKHLDPRAHEQVTGVGNRLILENLTRAAKWTKIWLRMPLIGGFNDDKAHMAKVIDLAREINAEKISLLPYHEGGRSKCEQIGRSYLYFGAQAPDEETIDTLKKMIMDADIAVGIGN